MEVIQNNKFDKVLRKNSSLAEPKSGKVSVVHYINKKIAARSYSGSPDHYYPLYIRITAKRQVTSIKSMFQDYLFTDTQPLEQQIDIKMLNFEKELIENFISKDSLLLKNPYFKISQVSSVHSQFVNIVHTYNENIINLELKKEIKSIFSKKDIDFDTFTNLFKSDFDDFDDLLKNKFSEFIEVFGKLIPELSKYQEIDLFELTMESAKIFEKTYGVRPNL